MPIKFTEEEERIIMGKTLVDANRIKVVAPCKMPVDGDLVRIQTDYGCVPAVYCSWPNYESYYVTQDGRMCFAEGTKVLEIIGKCVFSVYV